MTSPLYCSVQDYLSMFPQAAGAPASTLNLALTMASAYVRTYTQRELSLQTYTHEELRIIVDRNNRLVGKIRQWPIQSFSSLTILPMGTQVEQPLSLQYVDYMTPPERLFYYTGPLQFINTSSGYSGPWTITKALKGTMFATYTAGYPVIPDEVRSACILLTQYFVSRQANAMGAVSISVSAPSSSNSLSFGRRSLLLDDAEAFLDQYVRRE